MEENSQNQPKTLEELTVELEDIGILGKSSPLPKDEVKRRVYETLMIEGDDGVGKLILAFAKIVDYDWDAMKPFIERNSAFTTDLEELGHVKFYLETSQLLTLSKISKQLDKLLNILGVGTYRQEPLYDKFTPQWTKDELEKIKKSQLQNSVKITEEVIHKEESESRKIDLDGLIKGIKK
jgi:hypothetical protein